MPHRTKLKRKKAHGAFAAKELVAARKRRKAKAVRLSKKETTKTEAAK